MSTAKPSWVFGYGSLMWNPGFATPETQPARLHGWHRAFCIYSEHYRGTPQKPGLILGLPPARAAALMRRGRGATGTNLAYLRNTISHLGELGLSDRVLEDLARRAGLSDAMARP